MYTLFLLCAVIGGTVFLFQFVLTLVGLGGDDLDTGGDVPHDFDMGDMDVGHVGDVDVGHVGDVDAGHVGDVHDSHGGTDHGSTSLFGIISFRTVIAALTFFGLAGIVSLSNDVAPLPTVAVALIVGFLAMLAVHRMMRLLYSLGQDKTVRIERSVGARGTVYVPIPAKKQGAGKIQLRLQDRIVECTAMTGGPDKLPTGAKVVVTDVLSPTTLEVELVTDHDEAKAPVA